jgi:GntR family transcriptional repressor for pyruvate dehydrogenase complex
MSKSLPFRPIKKTRLYEDVAEQIKLSIFEGHLKPGYALPPERKLCEMFNVGRPTIREALRTLSIMGLIEVHPGAKGSIVKKYDINQYMEAVREQLSWLIKVEQETFKDLWEVKKYIELGIARSAAINATKNDLKNLDALIGKMETCTNDIHAYFPIANKFHQELTNSTKNKIFYLIWQIFSDITNRVYPPILEELPPEAPSILLEGNKTLLRAIKSRDPVAINKALEIHAKKEKFFTPHSGQINKRSNTPTIKYLYDKPLHIR